MAGWRGRYVNPWKWEDDWHMSLGRDEQKIFDYLLDCPRSAETLIGVYQLSLQVAAFHTKIDYKEVQRVFEERLQPDRKAFFEMGWVILPNWIKHQHFNENMWKAARNEFNRLPEWLRLLVFDENAPMQIDIKGLSKGILKFGDNDSEGLRTVSYDSERYSSLRNPSLPSGKEKGKGKLSLSGKEGADAPGQGAARRAEGEDEDPEAYWKRQGVQG
jgi:hypothetical protein